MNVAMIALHSSPVARLGGRDAGGMSVVLSNLAGALAGRGHRVDLFTLRGALEPGVAVDLFPGVRLFRLDVEGAAPAPKDRLHRHLPAAGEELRRRVAEQGPAYDLVYSHYWLSAVVGQEVSRDWDLPHLVTFHTLAAAKTNLACGEDEPRRRIDAERNLAGSSTRVIAPSPRERALTVNLCGVPAEQIAVVPWGVDGGEFRPGDSRAARRELGLPAEEELLLFVGRLVPVKGLDLLLRAFARVAGVRPRLRAVIAGGGGPDSREHRSGEALARHLGIADRVTWLGPVSRAEMPVLYRAADLLVVPSRYESFGLAALEALACGTPVVATRAGAMDEVVLPGRNGFLVEEPGAAALSAGIIACLSAPCADPAEVRSTVASWTWDRSAAMVEGLAAAL